MKHPKSLSSRLKLLTVLWVTAAVGSIVLTLLLSWRLEGGGAAINDAGSLRMQTYRLGLLISEGRGTEALARIEGFDRTLAQLKEGDPARPLFLPDTPEVQEQMQTLTRRWQNEIRPMLQRAAAGGGTVPEQKLDQFVDAIDALVLSAESVNARHTKWLRFFQSGLMVLVLAGAMVMVVLLYLWIIRPLDQLQQGVSDIHDGKLGVQVPIDGSAEFAEVDEGFNQMSLRLQQLYAHLEQEVAEKTRDLAEKNYTLGTLYFFSRFLGRIQTAAEAGETFLEKIMDLVPADAGSIRLLDFERERMDLVAHRGLPENLQTAEACRRLEGCFCGRAAAQHDWQPIIFTRPAEAGPQLAGCEKSGFHCLQVFDIRYNGIDLGLMTLYFKEAYEPEPGMRELIGNLCNQLAGVLSNIRLADESRQLAVLQERNLMAQGLHDSIAQTLTFLNLQVQMLESALVAQEQAQISENLQFIKEGVQECYEDVRELLLNFRTKISRKEFAEAVRTLSKRFEQQTQVEVNTVWRGDGPDLSSDQQLQFIFILQESLSNIRKHAQAAQVDIEFDNNEDFVMSIRDNGKGFDTGRLNELSGSHVGLGIMRERALRINARLEIDSQPGSHTLIRLTLPQQERVLL
ncbi:type IV pili methyl-accepting chemotaxis transducer N-terminal domain-containing protein [Neisseria sp.]|uniref:type IV pili methyl-accepting chemotaxis transducer N-terminal domain-containing protein n=1 Tax=Neisseria sp. TaxID=192066 RepID=UPI0026DC95DA|nr:type IV pili methyl-accepting chemotaxis transducer N-terminal domain-containing protein [Neisseria sp.]MDO4907990.1 type IV pili methyl-accepting chemotaxis transducer N-terminal domain-containing protein [Neisseria sp.]